MLHMTRIALLMCLACAPIWAQQLPSQSTVSQSHSPEINTTLMESTFLIYGPSARPGEEGKTRSGTCFVMLRRVKADSNQGQYVLVTATHVFEDIRGDAASVMLRKRNAAGQVEQVAFTLPIRSDGKNLYVENPNADVAAIDVVLPNDSIIVQLGSDITNIDWLATDKFLKGIGIHPGDELECLGYPMGIPGNQAGYAVLGSGKIASYPILPLKDSGKILYRFQAQPGYSGGPVYFSYVDRTFNGNLNLGMTYQKLFGLVVQKANPVGDEDPSIAIIVPSVYIKETIDKLAGFESTGTDTP
jgi:hypothetical protein